MSKTLYISQRTVFFSLNFFYSKIFPKNSVSAFSFSLWCCFALSKGILSEGKMMQFYTEEIHVWKLCKRVCVTMTLKISDILLSKRYAIRLLYEAVHSKGRFHQRNRQEADLMYFKYARKHENEGKKAKNACEKRESKEDYYFNEPPLSVVKRGIPQSGRNIAPFADIFFILNFCSFRAVCYFLLSK